MASAEGWMRTASTFFMVVTACAGACAGGAQQPTADSGIHQTGTARQGVAAAVEPDNAAAEIPSVTLAFKEQDAVAGAPFNGGWMTPVQCSPDGVPLVAFLNATSTPLSMDLYALDPKGGIPFRTSSAPGLYDVHFMGYFVSDSLVAAEVSATRDPTKGTRVIRPDVPPREMYIGKHQQFIIEFDRKGMYKQTVDLPAEYFFVHIALLSDDTFVALAYDRGNRVPYLFLLDSSGEILRPLEIPQEIENNLAEAQGEAGDLAQRASAQAGSNAWLFGTARGKVLFYQTKAHAPVLEIGAGGARREVPVTAPPGYSLSGVVPANDRWIMQFRKDGLSDNQAIDTRPQSHNFVYYEVDPNDGSLRRRIELAENSPMQMACEQDGVVVGFTNRNGKVIPGRADLPR